MTDFAQARKNMVDCQIHTSGVVHTGLLNAFETVPRELFVPEELKGVAYYDEAIPVTKNRVLLEPLTLSKMLEAANLTEDDVVLDIGGATGYAAAIMSPNVSTIIALESKEEYITAAEKNWKQLDACNIISCEGPLKAGEADKGPYDVIVLHGAVPQIPENLTAQLTQNGRMLLIIKKPGEKLGQATLVQSLGENTFSSYTLFECGADYLEGFAPKPAFSF
jgi:protein-L-isoaspartate(D-aspartate) O-methyltransferase